MKTRIFFILLALSVLSGCYAGMKLYPVKGPLAEQAPLPVFSGEITQTSAGGGNMSLTLPGGEVCKGRWKQVKPEPAAGGGSTTNALAAGGMSPVWDSIYGQGFYVAHVLGIRDHGASHITGDRGSVVDVEFILGHGEHDEPFRGVARGVARDNKGNIYKVAF